MTETVLDPPPPYPGQTVGSEQNAMPVAATGHTHVGFTAPQYPAYMPPPQQQFVSQQNTNVVTAQVDGGGNVYRSAPIPVDYKIQAWIACLCCFWPSGVFAILKASESRDALARGDLEAAHFAAESARRMIRLSFAFGISLVIISVIVMLIQVYLS